MALLLKLRDFEKGEQHETQPASMASNEVDDSVNISPAVNSPPRSNYDVFLSFRGADTRTGSGHLYSALLRDGIHPFLDDKEMETGGEVSPECLRGIEESRFSFVVLSKHYASSIWCLEELVHILKCRRERGHGVFSKLIRERLRVCEPSQTFYSHH
ncbi:Disease resistance protein Roq1 [Linum perenne]